MMRRMSTALACLIPMTLAAADDAAVKKEFSALKGSWKVVAGLQRGQEIAKDKLPRITYVLHADGKVTARTPEGETLGTLTVDPAKNPKTLDIVLESGEAKGKKQYAIYKLEGDKMTIFVTPPDSPDGDRPRDFTAKDTEARLLVFERVKGDDKK